MKIQYCSDLHLEFPRNNQFIKDNPLIPVGDILVLAGDIVPIQKIDIASDFFKFCSDNFKETYWIAGNHEFYYGDLAGKVNSYKESILSNVTLINNIVIDQSNSRLIFSTLWSIISNENARYINKALNDYRLIRDNGDLFTTARSNELFFNNIEFIKDSIEASEKEKNIIISHHVPTFKSYPEQYLKSNLNEAFASDLNDFIETYPIHSWIFGHHHRNVEKFNVGDTCLLTNQLGYVHNNENIGFKRDAVMNL